MQVLNCAGFSDTIRADQRRDGRARLANLLGEFVSRPRKDWQSQPERILPDGAHDQLAAKEWD
jgi:hypothetical protein